MAEQERNEPDALEKAQPVTKRETDLTIRISLGGALLLCLGWLLLSLWLASHTAACPGHPLGASSWVRYLGCRSPNEVGDFLAGIMSPIAVIILALAAFIQSRELRSQQTELEETRKVFKEQRDLMKEQIREAKRSADLFEAQNEILKAQELARLANERRAQFEETLVRLETIIRTRLNARLPILAKEQSHMSDIWRLFPLFQEKILELPTDRHSAIGTAITSALHVKANIKPHHDAQVYAEYEHREAFKIAVELAKRAVTKADELGGDTVDLVGYLRISAFSDLLQSYLNNNNGNRPLGPALKEGHWK